MIFRQITHDDLGCASYLVGDEDATTPGKAVNRRVYDPAAGTGGMLSTMDEHLRDQNPAARLLMACQKA